MSSSGGAGTPNNDSDNRLESAKREAKAVGGGGGADGVRLAKEFVLRRQLSLNSSVPLLLFAAARDGDLGELKIQLAKRSKQLENHAQMILDLLSDYQTEVKRLFGLQWNRESSVLELNHRVGVMAAEFNDLRKDGLRPLRDLRDKKDNLNLLEIAAKHGYVEMVRFLVDECEMGKEAQDGAHLHLAAANNHLEVVKYLIDDGAVSDIHCKYKSGGKVAAATALHQAISHPRIVECLIERKASLNILDDSLKTPVHLAVEGCHLETLSVIEKSHPSSSSHESLYHGLQCAARAPYPKSFHHLLRMLPPQDQEKERGLYAESMSKLHVGIARAFHEEKRFGVDERVSSDRSRTPLLDVLTLEWDKSSSSYSSSSSSSPSPYSSAKRRLSFIRYLVREAKADVNIYTDLGASPLSLAIKSKNLAQVRPDVLRELIEGKADVDRLTEPEGMNHIFICAERCPEHLGLFLTHSRAQDVNHLWDQSGRTLCGALAWNAAAYKFGTAMRDLLEAKADVNRRMEGDLGATPLILAVKNNSQPPTRTMRVVQLFVEAFHVDVLARDLRGFTAADQVKEEVKAVRSSRMYRENKKKGKEDYRNKAYTLLYKFLRKHENKVKAANALMRDCPRISMLYSEIAKAMNLHPIHLDIKSVVDLVEKNSTSRPTGSNNHGNVGQDFENFFRQADARSAGFMGGDRHPPNDNGNPQPECRQQ